MSEEEWWNGKIPICESKNGGKTISVYSRQQNGQWEYIMVIDDGDDGEEIIHIKNGMASANWN